jgi:hypothetical protein
MTDDEILEMADRYDFHERYFPYRDELIAFAHLIIERQKEIDAEICDEWGFKTGDICAEAIRSQK